MRRFAAASAALLLAAACVRRPVAVQATMEIPAAGLDADADAVRSVVAAFLAAEAAFDAAADTLLTLDATFIRTGLRLTVRPRAAGINGAGRIVVDEEATSLAGNFALVVVGYRFESATPALNERARGSFLLARRPGGWKVAHAHTSMVERW